MFRTLAGSVVVCEPRSARRVLADPDGVLDHVPAFWRPGGEPLPSADQTALNRWVHRGLADEDVAATAKLAVDAVAAARGADLHRTCLFAVADAVAQPLASTANPGLGDVVREFLDTVFLTVVTGDRPTADNDAFARLIDKATAALADGPRPDLPDLPDGVEGEIYLRAVTSFVGATSAALGWLICVFGADPLPGTERAGDVRGAAPEHVALETLRLWPPAWQHRRPVLADHRIEPVRALRGDDIVVPVFSLHRHPDHWRAPDVFDPDRWADEPHPAAFLPFAVGPGACVGATFEVRWLAAAARHLAEHPPMRLTRVGAAPRLTAILSPAQHVLG